MTMAVVRSRANQGLQAIEVTIETHISNGLPRFSMVGLPEVTVKESKDRVRSAILNSHFEFPAWRIVVNLAPADLPKEGSRLDLPIALSILCASRQIPKKTLFDYELAGELALSGELRPVNSLLPFAYATYRAGKILICPEENLAELNCLTGLRVCPANHLLEVCAHLKGKASLPIIEIKPNKKTETNYPDMADVVGQAQAKRALEIAAAGGHSMLMIGAPGSGKSMLASRLPGLLPAPNVDESVEMSVIHSLINKHGEQIVQRPFRSPHHTASHIALVGGGNPPKPGEVTLAHHGVLFLDEIPEFKRQTLEVLREPLEVGQIHIARAANYVEFPAAFQLIAAMNPCPCGRASSKNKTCHCSKEQIMRYRAKLSAPLLDRIDMFIEVFPVSAEELTQSTASENSQQIRERVNAARQTQIARAATNNANLSNEQCKETCVINEKLKTYLAKVITDFKLSARAYYRVLRIARTIADLEAAKHIQKKHLNEAISLRRVKTLFEQDLHYHS